MIKINNISQIQDSLRGFLDGLNRLAFSSDVIKEVRENINNESPHIATNKKEALKEAAYQGHKFRDQRSMEDALRRLPKPDQQKQVVEDDFIERYIIDYLNDIFSEV